MPSVCAPISFSGGYCGVREIDAGSWLAVTHFQPPKHGGDDSADNLVYACRGCHLFKGSYWQTEPERRLLHPLLDDRERHYREQADGTLLALTPRGANHIAMLHLRGSGRHPRRSRERETLDRRIKETERFLTELEQLQAALAA